MLPNLLRGPQRSRGDRRKGAIALAALSVVTSGVGVAVPSPVYAADPVAATMAWAQRVLHPVALPELPPAVRRGTHSYLAASTTTTYTGQSIKLTAKVTVDDLALHRPSVGEVVLPRQTLSLEVDNGGAWTSVASAVIGADGVAHFTVSPSKSASYRVVYGGTVPFDASTSEVASITVREPVVVRPVVTTSSTSSSRTSSSTVGGLGSNGGSSGSGAAVVAAAAAQAGDPYVYGAAGPNAFDCSGLTKFVFAQFGINLPHNADAQKNYGSPVAWANARPGDLLIFVDGGYGYHAAIYAGGNQMWDAPTSGSTVGLHTIWSSNFVIRRLV